MLNSVWNWVTGGLAWMWDKLVTPFAWIAAMGGFLWENLPMVITRIDLLTAQVQAMGDKLHGLPFSSIFGYVNRVYPLNEHQYLVLSMLVLMGISMLVRMTKAIALWWSGG